MSRELSLHFLFNLRSNHIIANHIQSSIQPCTYPGLKTRRPSGNIGYLHILHTYALSKSVILVRRREQVTPGRYITTYLLMPATERSCVLAIASLKLDPDILVLAGLVDLNLLVIGYFIPLEWDWSIYSPSNQTVQLLPLISK